MSFGETKVYRDGSHYIAIPHTTRPTKPRRKRIEEVITVTEEPELENDCMPVETEENIVVEQELKEEEKEPVKADNKVKTQRQMTKRELFDELYQKYLNYKPNKRRDLLIESVKEYFPSIERAVSFVDCNIERKKRNLISRRIRLYRKANLQEFNYFVTFTYDSKKHTEESFRKKLTNCFSLLSSRKQWKYIGVWERSPEKKRLHFHGIFYIPDGTMQGELKKVADYSPIKGKVQYTVQNTYFNEKFGRSDFEEIGSPAFLGQCVAYLVKYLEKTGEKLVYSKGLPQYFVSDILDDDIVCTMGADNQKLLLFDDFKCFDEGTYMGQVSKEVIAQMPKEN